MAQTGNSNTISREYLDSLLIETRYMNSTIPNTEFELYGEKFASPIMTAALSHLDHFGAPGMAMGVAQGAKDADCVLWYGMSEEEEIERLASTGAKMIEIIKPYGDRDIILRKMEHAQKLGLLAVGIDIDHPFNDDGTWDPCEGNPLKALTTAELREICEAVKLPVIIKGVLSCYDADEGRSPAVRRLHDPDRHGRVQSALPWRQGRLHRPAADDRLQE